MDSLHESEGSGSRAEAENEVFVPGSRKQEGWCVTLQQKELKLTGKYENDSTHLHLQTSEGLAIQVEKTRI